MKIFSLSWQTTGRVKEEDYERMGVDLCGWISRSLPGSGLGLSLVKAG